MFFYFSKLPGKKTRAHIQWKKQQYTFKALSKSYVNTPVLSKTVQNYLDHLSRPSSEHHTGSLYRNDII